MSVNRSSVIRPKETIKKLLPALLLFIPSILSASDSVSVTTKTLAEIQIFPHHSAPATVISLNESLISAQLSARITQVAVRVGDTVKKNQLLVKLDCRDAKLIRQSNAARKQLAEKELARGNKLKLSSSIALSNLNQRQTELVQAQVAHQQANLQVERCSLKSPYHGVITERIAAVGSLAAPGSPMIRLVDIGRLELKASLSDHVTHSLMSATTLMFTAGGEKYPIKLRTVMPMLDPQSNNRSAHFDFIKSKPLTGTSGRIDWHENAHHIPATIIVERQGQLGIFVDKANIAKFVPLTNAQTGQDVATSLPAETQVIIDGRFGLKADDPIRVTNP